MKAEIIMYNVKPFRFAAVLLLLLTFCATGFSQTISESLFSLNKKKQQKPNPKMISLEKLIKKIESDQHIIFLYKTVWLKDKYVPASTLEQDSLGFNLGAILQKEGLTYSKITSRSYAIRPQTDMGDESKKLMQVETVTGTVTDAESGETMPGVNILVKGTTTGTSTEQDGTFELTVSSLQDTLVVSFVGYRTQEVPITGQAELDIELIPEAVAGEELIVVGYGTQQESDVTGSVQRVNSETFQDQSMTQLNEMLTGTVAGFNASQGTSASGGSSMEVRGPNSLTAGTDPLIVLDGVIYNGSLRDINPNDIETIDILKDASSAAVYGAKAASGVVLVTTSKGEQGAPRINFSSSIGISEVTNSDIQPLNPEEYTDFRRDLLTLENPEQSDYYYYNPDELPGEISVEEWRNYSSNPNDDNTREWLNRLLFFGPEIENYLAGRTEDWFDQVMRAGVRQKYDLSLSGGTEDIRYYWSLGYTDNKGIIVGDKFAAIRSRLNINADVADFLEIGLNSQFSDRDESTVPADLGDMLIASPYGTTFDEDGNLNWYPNGYQGAPNPVVNTLKQDRLRKLNTFFGSIYAEVSLPFGITHRVSFQPRLEFLRDYNYWSPETIIGGENVSNGQAERRDFRRFEWMVDNLLTWEKEFGVHRFDLTLLHNVEVNRSWNSFMSNETFQPRPTLGYSGLHFGNNPDINTNDTKVTGDALMGRINYALMDKYLFTASVRRDGYSAFGQDQPRAVFPAAAFAWQIQEEEFFTVNWINQLKLRFSWGVNGNRDIGAYSALARLNRNVYSNGSQVLTGVYNASLANSSLAWEQTESYNIGLDVALFEDRITATIDLYDMSTTDLLINRSLPQITGYNSITANLGELANRGFEFELNTTNMSSTNFSWSSDFIFSLNRNEIKRLHGDFGEYTLLNETYEGEIPDFANDWFPGRSIGAVWDYDIIGIWQEEEAGEAAEYGARPGDYKAIDVNDDGNYTELADKQFIGHREPRYRFGLRNEFSHKNFSASMFIRSELGHIGSIPVFKHEQSNLYDRRGTRSVPYWTAENPSNEYGSLAPSAGVYGGDYNIYFSRSYVRIQDVSLSYSVPSEVVSQFLLREMRIYGSIRNLYSFDNWKNWDPESGASPMPRVFTIGIDIQL